MELPRPYSAKRLVLDKIKELKSIKAQKEREEKKIMLKRDAEVKKKIKLMKKQEKDLAARKKSFKKRYTASFKGSRKGTELEINPDEDVDADGFLNLKKELNIEDNQKSVAPNLRKKLHLNDEQWVSIHPY